MKFNSKKMEKMNKLPKGEFLNVRFDIDDGGGVNSYCATSCSDSGNPLGVTVTCSQQCSGATNCLNAFKNTYPAVMGNTSIPIASEVQNLCTDINNMNKNSSSYTTIANKDVVVCSIM